MKISILCSDKKHPVIFFLKKWINQNSDNYQIELVHNKAELLGGDILFLVSCAEIVTASDRALYGLSLVLHASNLPLGRGWSPHIWEIIRGAELITLSLIEAQDQVDTGRIWHQMTLCVPKHALWNEINEQLFNAEVTMIEFAINNINAIVPRCQDLTIAPTYYLKRTPDSSKLDVQLSIASQFDLIRVCDPARFPAFFEMYGQKYKITLEKINGMSNEN